MSAALFGNSARASSKNLVEFRAGKMHMKSKMVHPDKRKGLVYLYQADDSLMHFCWKDRASGSVEEDLIIFPDDCEYKRVTACTSGRAYVLKFRSTTRRLFFWMQEPKTDKDDEHCRKINELLNNPPTPGSHSTPSRSGGSGGVTGGSGGGGAGNLLSSDLSNLRDSDLHNIIGNISQQQLMQILGSGVPSLSTLLGSNSGSSSRSNTTVTPTTASTPTTATTPPPSTTSTTTTPAATTASTATTAASTPMETSTGATGTSTGGSSTGGSSSGGSKGWKYGTNADLQNLLSAMLAQEETSGGASSGPGVDLSPALTAEALQPILNNPEFVEKLRPFLPETAEQTLPSASMLRGTLTSPQFQQAVTVFSHALQSGQLGPLVKQFGLSDDAVAAAAAADMEAFIKALGKKADDTNSTGKESKEEKKDDKAEKDEDKDDDEAMAVD